MPQFQLMTKDGKFLATPILGPGVTIEQVTVTLGAAPPPLPEPTEVTVTWNQPPPAPATPFPATMEIGGVTYPTVTKRAAFKHLIERVFGKRPMAFRADVSPRGICVYNPAFNGGCALGHFIPPALYAEAQSGGYRLENPELGASQGAPMALGGAYSFGALFEDRFSVFWSQLQAGHDHYACGDYESAASSIGHAFERL
jgi:hypothetical protein